MKQEEEETKDAASGGGAAASGAMPAPKDLTAWVNPAGGTAAAAGEFKMDFEGKREVVDAARCAELLATARQGGRVDFGTVSLANKSYTAEGAAALAAVLRTFQSSCKVANMADIIAGRMEAEALVVLKTICDALGHLDLAAVDLSDNALGEKGVRCCEAILLNKRCLESLWFNNNGISAECAAVIAEIVTSTQPTKLKLFHFHNNMSGPVGAAALAGLVVASPLLQDLRFSGTRCLSAGSVAMAKGVAALAAQQVAAHGAGLFVRLDLADNCFGEEGSALLAQALVAGQPALRLLNLRDAGLGDEGAVAVCTAVAGTAAGLVTLELSGNELTEESMAAVAACIAAKAQLATLGLEENELGTAGALVLGAALAKMVPNATLTSLSLGTNEMGSGGALAVAKALKGFSALSSLGLNGNMISAPRLATLRTVLQANGHTAALGEDPFDENDESGDEDEEEEDGS